MFQYGNTDIERNASVTLKKIRQTTIKDLPVNTGKLSLSNNERFQSRSVAGLPLTNNEGNNYIWQLLRCCPTKLLQIDDEAYVPPT